MRSNDALHEWASKFLNESDFQRFIVPFIQQRQSIPSTELKILYQSLLNASEPPQELLDINYENS